MLYNGFEAPDNISGAFLCTNQHKSFWSNDAQISECQPHDDQVLLVLLQHQCFLAQQFILDDLYKIVREQCTATMEFVIPVFKDYRMVFR